MGAWGHGPFDNDPASDLISGLMKPVRTVVERKTDKSARHSYAEARAGAQFILAAHGTDILGGPSLDTVLKALMRMRSDVEWLSDWRSPRSVAKALDREIAAVVDKVRTCKGCRSYRAETIREMEAFEAPRPPTSSVRVLIAKSRRKRRKKRAK